MDDRTRLFGAVLAEFQEELDWERLGRAYCEGDGTTFFDDELRERWLDTGLQIAETLSEALAGSRGRSVYVGAALAEVPVMLVESLVLGRSVTWVNLPGDEMDELTRVLRLVSAKLDVPLPLPSFEPLESLPTGAFDHVWMVSVLTDPDHFPALHDELYERHGTDLATNAGLLGNELGVAARLIRSMWKRFGDSALLCTTREELVAIRNTAPLGDQVRAFRQVFSYDATALVGDQLICLRIALSDAHQLP